MTTEDVELERFRERVHERRPGKLPRIPRSALWIAAALALGAFGWKGPHWMVAHGASSATACSDEKLARSTPIGDSCRPTIWLGVPRLFAWGRDEARDTAQRLDRTAAERDLQWATRAVAKPAEAERAASRLGALLDASAPPGPPIPPFDDLSHTLVQSGAIAALARQRPGRSPAVLRARLWLGDVPGATEAALMPPPGATDDFAPERGAFLCLVHRESVGRAVLGAIRDSSRIEQAREALALCGDVRAQATLPPRDWNTVSLSNPTWQQGRRAAAAREIGEPFERTNEAHAARIVEEADLQPVDVVEMLVSRIHPRGPDGGFLPSSEAIEGITSPHYGVVSFASGAMLEKAAERLERWASAGGDLSRDMEARSAGDDEETHAQSWPLLFRRFAWALRVEASASYERTGDRARSAEAALAAARVAPDALGWLSARRLLAAGKTDDALRLCREAEASPRFGAMPSGDRSFILVTEALASARLGQWKQAADAAAHTGDEGLWLRAAIELQTGSNEPLDTLGRREPSGDPKDDPANWVALARAPEAKLAELRTAISLPSVEMGAMAPAMLFVMGRVAPPGGDVDLWLDGEAAGMWASGRLRPLLRARAEAARWSGQDERVARLEARADALDHLVVDVKTALLAEMAGL